MRTTTAIPTLLACVLLASAVPAQTWVTELASPLTDECALGVSPSGLVAVVRNQDGYSGFTVLGPDGQLVREFKRTDAALTTRSLYAARFLDDSRLAVCGSRGSKADGYVAVLDVQTGVTVWEQGLTGYALPWRMALGPQGEVIVGGIGSLEGFVASYSPSGATQWIRAYDPTDAGCAPTGFAFAPDGDLYVQLVDANRDLTIVRSDLATGAAVWARTYTLAEKPVEWADLALAPDGDLLMGLQLGGDDASTLGALRVDDQGTVEWAREYTLPLQQPQWGILRGLRATPDGSLLIGSTLVDFPGTTESPGVLRVRPDGSPQWSRHYGDPLTDGSWTVLASTSDGGFVGVSSSATGARVFRASAGGEVGTCAGAHAAVVSTPLTATDAPVDGSFEIFSGSASIPAADFPLPDATSVTQLCSQACAPAASYCLAKQNSAGCTPRIGSSGSAGINGPGITVTASQVVNLKQGLLFWGHEATGTPFQGGLKCVASPLERTPAQSSGGSATGKDCSGGFAFTFDPAYLAAQGVAVGDTLHCQYWYRDPAAPFTTGLTDALQFTVCP